MKSDVLVADKSLAVIGFPISFGSNDPLLGNVLNSVSQIPSLGNTTILPELSFVALKGHFQSHTVFRFVSYSRIYRKRS